MDFESRVRIGFVGVGGMGQCAHLRNYVEVEGCEVAAIAELREELGRRVAEKYGVKRVYRDYREMLKNERLDAIVAIGPFQMHGALVPELLAYGKPVLTEKPLARSVEVGEKIVAASKRSGAKHFVGYHKRSDPAVVWAKEKIEQWKSTGKMGAMKLVRITMPPGDWMAGGFSDLVTSDEPYPAMQMDAPPSGMDELTAKKLDAFVNYYIHQVNLMRHLMGEGHRVTHADASGVVMVARSDSGVAGVLEMGPWRTSVGWEEAALVCFEKTWIRVELPAPLARCAGKVTAGVEGKTEAVAFEGFAMQRQAENFVKAVKGEETPLCEGEEALEDLRIAETYVKTGG